ncbi:MAG: hypothetical protein ACRD16_16210 [Thermoanaerobaculia bacterium]
MAEFETLCPQCHSRLKIDTDLKAVIDSSKPPEAKTFENLDAAMGHLRTQDRERDAKFKVALESEKSKKDVLEKKFEELFKKAQSDTSKPVRDIDLD